MTATGPLRRWHRARLATVGWVVLGLGSTLLSSAAQAQVLFCKSHSLAPRDRAAAVAVARAAFGKGAHVAPIPRSFCRNPDVARAWFETSRHVNSEGALEWHEVSCMRERAAWACDSPRLAREIELDAPVSGRSRHFVISLDPDTSVEAVRSVLPQASAILFERQPTHPPACWPGTHDEETWAGFRDRSVAGPMDGPIRLDARTENGALKIGDGLILLFRPAPVAADVYQVCWEIEIVVT